MKKRKDGRYRKIVDGVCFYGETERDVYRRILEHTEKQIRGKLFSEVADEWWNIEAEQLSPSTVRGYRKATERVLDFFGDIYVSDVSAADITKFLHYLARAGFSKKTVKNHKIIVSRILHYATVECYIKTNPARDAELPRNLSEKKRKAAPQIDEIKIKNTPLDDWQLPFVALMTGMRKGEIIGLKWSDIDLSAGIINVSRSVWYGDGGSHVKSTKTDAGERVIPIVDDLKVRLTEIIERDRPDPNHFVFSGSFEPLSEKAYRYRLKKFNEKYGITSTLHQLRKSFATAAVDAEVPPDVLKQIIGHRDISTTLNIYAEVRDHRIKSAGTALSKTLKKVTE